MERKKKDGQDVRNRDTGTNKVEVPTAGDLDWLGSEAAVLNPLRAGGVFPGALKANEAAATLPIAFPISGFEACVREAMEGRSSNSQVGEFIIGPRVM